MRLISWPTRSRSAAARPASGSSSNSTRGADGERKPHVEQPLAAVRQGTRFGALDARQPEKADQLRGLAHDRLHGLSARVHPLNATRMRAWTASRRFSCTSRRRKEVGDLE